MPCLPLSATDKAGEHYTYNRGGHWNVGAILFKGVVTVKCKFEKMGEQQGCGYWTGLVTGILGLQQGWSLEYWCYNRDGHWNTGATTKQGWLVEYWCYNKGGHLNTGATTGVVSGILVLQLGWSLEHWCYNKGVVTGIPV